MYWFSFMVTALLITNDPKIWVGEGRDLGQKLVWIKQMVIPMVKSKDFKTALKNVGKGTRAPRAWAKIGVKKIWVG